MSGEGTASASWRGSNATQKSRSCRRARKDLLHQSLTHPSRLRSWSRSFLLSEDRRGHQGQGLSFMSAVYLEPRINFIDLVWFS